MLGIPWGASEDDVRRIMKERPGTEYWTTQKDAKQTWQKYTGPFNDERAVIHVYFYQGKMFQVDIIHYLGEDRLLGKFNELKAGMSQRYGPPLREWGKYLDSGVLWDLGPNYLAGLAIRKSDVNQPERPFVVILGYWQEDVYGLVHPKAGIGPGSDKDF